MNSKTLSVCLIAKNEEKNIDRCLESIKSIADEIIVVDTGSTDKTVEIAKSYNAKVGYFKWNNNFSDARNESLKMATKDWILFLDADEEISKEESIRLKNLINTTNLEAFHCRLVNIIKSINIGDAIVLRVFKNNPKYRFRGKIHEQIFFSIEETSGSDSIGLSDIKILHYGYDPEVADMNLKQKRNLALLESYDEKDKDGYYYYSLGNEYSRLNDIDKALDIYYKGYNPECKSSYMPYLCVNIAKTLYTAKRYYREINEIDKFTKIYPNLRDLYFFKALAAIECNKFTLAKESILDYFKCDLEEYIYPNNNFDSLYNIAQLLTKVKRECIHHEKNLLSASIVLLNQIDFVTNTIKSLNEVCDEIVVVVPKDSDVNIDSLTNIGANVILSDTSDSEENFMLGYKNCNCKYNLVIKPNEILTIENKKLMINVLSNYDYINFLNLIVIDVNTQEKFSEFRIFKNTDTLKEMECFSSFVRFVEEQSRQQASIYIQRY